MLIPNQALSQFGTRFGKPLAVAMALVLPKAAPRGPRVLPRGCAAGVKILEPELLLGPENMRGYGFPKVFEPSRFAMPKSKPQIPPKSLLDGYIKHVTAVGKKRKCEELDWDPTISEELEEVEILVYPDADSEADGDDSRSQSSETWVQISKLGVGQGLWRSPAFLFFCTVVSRLQGQHETYSSNLCKKVLRAQTSARH